MSKKSNRINVPEAREAMDKFKMEAANEVGVNLKQGYNGDLTSREAGFRGRPDGQEDDDLRTMSYMRQNRTAMGINVCDISGRCMSLSICKNPPGPFRMLVILFGSSLLLRGC